MSENKIRVLMSKPGIDGHWRGGIVVSRALRDAGMELIFGDGLALEFIKPIHTLYSAALVVTGHN